MPSLRSLGHKSQQAAGDGVRCLGVQARECSAAQHSALAGQGITRQGSCTEGIDAVTASTSIQAEAAGERSKHGCTFRGWKEKCHFTLVQFRLVSLVHGTVLHVSCPATSLSSMSLRVASRRLASRPVWSLHRRRTRPSSSPWARSSWCRSRSCSTAGRKAGRRPWVRDEGRMRTGGCDESR